MEAQIRIRSLQNVWLDRTNVGRVLPLRTTARFWFRQVTSYRGESAMTLKARLLFFGGLAGLILISGCQARSTPAKSAPVLPKGVTVNVAGRGLALSAWVPSGTVDTSPVDVRLTLRNNSGRTLRWSEFNFGILASTVVSRTPLGPETYSLAFGPQVGIGRPWNWSKERSPLVLRSGEATSLVLPMQMYYGTWTVRGFAFPGDERLETPTITVVVR